MTKDKECCAVNNGRHNTIWNTEKLILRPKSLSHFNKKQFLLFLF